MAQILFVQKMFPQDNSSIGPCQPVELGVRFVKIHKKIRRKNKNKYLTSQLFTDTYWKDSNVINLELFVQNS